NQIKRTSNWHHTNICLDIKVLQDVSLLKNIIEHKNFCVTSLSIRFSKITNKWAQDLAEMLKENENITSLCFNGNTFVRTETLAEMLKGNKNITSLELNYNFIEKLAVANMLKENKNITCLKLIDNLLGVEGTKELAAVLKGNNSIKHLRLRKEGFG